MTQQELTQELLKFNPAEVSAVYDLGWGLDVGMRPTQDQIVDAVFALERLAESYPAYAYVYRGLLEAIDTHLSVGIGVANNPAGLDAQGELCRDTGYSEQPDRRANPDAEPEPVDPEEVQIEVQEMLLDGRVQHAEFVKEGMAFDFDTCDHHDLPPALEARTLEAEKQLVTGAPAIARNPQSHDAASMIRQQLLLAEEGLTPVPWAEYAETFNYEEAPPPWIQAQSAEIISIAPETRYQERLLAANPLPKGIERQLQAMLPPDMQKLPGYLLGSNPKLAKGGDMCWLSAGVSLAPWTVAGVTSMCPFASKGCATGCLNISGQAEMQLKAKKQTIARSRIFKTKLLMQHADVFAKYLEHEIARWEEYAHMVSADWPKTLKKDVKWHANDVCSEQYGLSVRMNVLSDRPWELAGLRFNWSDGQFTTVMEKYPDIQFYDYTKWPSRMAAFLGRNDPGSAFPPKYWLTFSWSEINVPVAFQVLDRGGNVAVAFDTRKGKALPEEFCGYPVIDADDTDFRFLDNVLHEDVKKAYPGKGLICGLRLKGQRHRRNFNAGLAAEGDLPVASIVESRGIFTGGFTQYSEDCGMRNGKLAAKNITNEPWYKERLIEQSKVREAEQKKQGFKGTPGWRVGA